MSHEIPQVIMDLGYYATKILYQNKTSIIQSKVEKIDPSINSKGITIKFNDETYLIGEGAKQHDINIRKQDNESYRIIVYAILASFGSGIYNLVVTYPLNYLNKNSTLEIQNYLKTPGIDILINNKTQRIIINSVLVVPQTASILYVNPLQYKNKIIGFLDWGGITVSGCIFNNLNIINESKFSEHTGSLYIYEEIKNTLNQQYCINIQDYEIPYIINNGLFDSKETINSILNKTVQNVKQQCKLNKWNVDNIPILHSGGTSIFLKEYIQNHFPTSIFSENPIYDNCYGALTIADQLKRRNAI